MDLAGDHGREDQRETSDKETFEIVEGKHWLHHEMLG